MATTLLDARGHAISQSDAPATSETSTPAASAPLDERRRKIAELIAPFPSSEIGWTVLKRERTNKRRGQIAPFITRRMVLERLNEVLGEGQWTRTYEQTTISNIPYDAQDRNGRITKTTLRSKITLICNLTLPDIGTGSGTGEAWTDEDNAMTSADAQAFKRAAECFGIGMYLRRVPKIWTDLDDHDMPVTSPMLPDFAISAEERAARQRQKPENSGDGNNRPDGNDKGPGSGAGSPSGSGHGTSSAGQPQTGSEPPTIDQRRETDPAFIQQLQLRAAKFKGFLGDALYQDIVTPIKNSRNPDETPTGRARRIEAALTAACEKLTHAHQIASELSGNDVARVFNHYRLTDLSKIPTLKMLEDIAMAFDTVQAAA